MEILCNNSIVLNADDECPDCLRCINCMNSDEFCCNFCGADNGWRGYERHTTEKEFLLTRQHEDKGEN